MAITPTDFEKIWSTNASTPAYTFNDADYLEGWDFVGNLPPTRAQWNAIQKRTDEKMKYVFDNFGAPLTASTVAEMTLQNRVYVYIGSEVGYTAGDWYYYDEGTSAWVDGGVYNAVAVVTDTTLTQAGVPADANVTGEQVNNLSNLVLNDTGLSETGSWTLNKYRNSGGTLKTASGYAISGARRSITAKAFTVNDSAYEFGVNCYTGTTVQSSTRIGTYGWFKAGTVFCFPKGTGTFTIQLHKLDGTAITDANIETVKPSVEYLAPTDKTLLIDGASADAKVTGEQISGVNANIANLTGCVLNKTSAVYSGTYVLGKYREIGSNTLVTATGYAITNGTTIKAKAIVLRDSNYQLGISCYTKRPIGSSTLINTIGWFDANTMVYLLQGTGVYTIQLHKVDGTAITDEDMTNVLPLIEFYDLTGETEDAKYKVLALGDSICRGGRNKSKGFVGDLGLPYINMGVGGATVSSKRSTYGDSIHQFPEADTIPNQLTSYYNRSAEDIQTAFGKEKFVPDVIIADGGINDYIYTAPMGTMSNAPASTDEEATLLDTSTLLGGLEYLFYQMIKLYHMAQRYFVITHKTGRPNGDYYPTRKSGANYTQQEMHDAIVTCCHLYGVIPVDVYQDGIMDTKYSQYRTTADNYTNAEPTDYCDKDGVHPLAYGYQQVYVPLIKTKLSNATRKDDAEDESE